MSVELAYFPPRGTKYKWHPKSLNYSPWTCRLSDERESKIRFKTDMSVACTVDKIDGKYKWNIEVRHWDPNVKVRRITGMTDDPLKACLEAERVGDVELGKMLPDWVRTALENNWRPPAVSHY